MAIQKITAPSRASTHYVSIIPEHRLQFDFDTSSADVDRSGNDLTLTFNDGDTTVIRDFFVTDGADLPVLVLSDGTEISSSDLLQNMNPALDLTTAAGPTASAHGSGAGEYADGVGELLGGVDALGSLGTTQWNRSVGIAETSESMGLNIPPTATEALPAPTPEPEPNYVARAVLYKTSDTASSEVCFQLLNPDGTVSNSQSYEILVDPDQASFFNPVVKDNGNGTFSLTLTPEGLAALEAEPGDNLYAYVTITVDGNEPYRMQIVANKSGSFSSADEDQISNNGANLGGYEWHSETNGTGLGDRDGALNANNNVWFGQGEIPVGFSGDFSSGKGNDIITIHGKDAGMSGGSIDTGINGGKDTVTVTGNTGLLAENQQQNNHIKNAEEVVIDGKSTAGLSANGGGNSLTDNGEINITGFKNGLFTSGIDSINSLQNTDGDVTISATATGSRISVGGYGLFADKGGVNEILDTAGTLTVETFTNGIGLYASNGGTNSIHNQTERLDLTIDGKLTDSRYNGTALEAYGGKNEIIASGQGTNDHVAIHGIMYARGYTDPVTKEVIAGTNTIDTGSGHDIVNVNGSVRATTAGSNIFKDIEVLTIASNTSDGIDTTPNGSGLQNGGSITGLYATRGGENIIENAGSVTINLQSTFKGISAISSDTESSNIVTAEKLHINIDSDSGASGIAGNNTIDVAEELKIVSITSASGISNYGVHASRGSKNVIDAGLDGKVIIEMGGGSARGLSAQDGGENIIKTSNIDIRADGEGYSTHLMYASGEGHTHNTIQAVEGRPLEVTLTIASGEGSKLYAMYAYGGNKSSTSAENNIIGSELADKIDISGDIYSHFRGKNLISTGDGDDVISINGDMIVDYYSANTITTGEGNDIITISGDIIRNDSRGSNSIDTGEDDDYLHLLGSVGANGLTLQMGEGYDTLILKADSSADFEAKYGAWLKGGALKGAGVEAIHIDWDGSEEDYQTFLDTLNGYPGIGDQNLDISHSIQDNASASETLYLGDLSEIDLSGLLVSSEISENLTIDLSGGKENSFTMADALFGANNELSIISDGKDTIDLGEEGNWIMGDIDYANMSVDFTSGGGNTVHISVDDTTMDQAQLDVFFNSILNS